MQEKSLTQSRTTSETGHMVVPVAHKKKEDYEKEKDGEREKITVTKTDNQRCEERTEHLLEDSEKEMKDKVCKHFFSINKHSLQSLDL